VKDGVSSCVADNTSPGLVDQMLSSL